MVKNLPVQETTRDAGSISGFGRSPVGGSGNPLQYSCLENSMDRAWQATVHGVAKSRTQLNSQLALPLCLLLKSQLYLGGWWMCFTKRSFYESLKFYANFMYEYIFFSFESVAFFWFSKKVNNYWHGAKYRSVFGDILGMRPVPPAEGGGSHIHWPPWPHDIGCQEMGEAEPGRADPRAPKENANFSLLFLLGWFSNPISNPPATTSWST